jgi:hypothetical protein
LPSSEQQESQRSGTFDFSDNREELKNRSEGKMNRKIIIKSDDFNKEIFSFLKEVGADMPLDWNIEAFDCIKNAVIETFEKMGVTLEIDDRLQPIPLFIKEKQFFRGL